MAGGVAALKDKIQRYLTQSFDNVTIDRDGDFSLRHGSARGFVRACTVESGDWAYVSVWSPFLFEVKPTPELFEYVALHTDDRIFGHPARAHHGRWSDPRFQPAPPRRLPR